MGSTAAGFGCDPEAADQLSRALAEVRDEMRQGRSSPGAQLGVTGSASLAAVLEEFGAAAFACRNSLHASLDEAATLFAALAKGTLDLDSAFAERAVLEL